MAWWKDRIVPHLVNRMCARHDFDEPRRRALAGLRGVVVEIGFGSGHNLAHYPPTVDRVLAVEPSNVARRLAEPRLEAASVPVEFAGLDGQHLDLADDAVDGAVSTFTLCTIPDAHRALREVMRVLRPGGRLHFLEHGLSPDPDVAAWQHRLTPIQRRVLGGCHLDRPIAELLGAAGLRMTSLDNFYLSGPKAPGYAYLGTAEPGQNASPRTTHSAPPSTNST
jgi:SAM-dependent methyltransferase